MVSGLDYLTEQPAPAQSGLAAAAPVAFNPEEIQRQVEAFQQQQAASRALESQSNEALSRYIAEQAARGIEVASTNLFQNSGPMGTSGIFGLPNFGPQFDPANPNASTGQVFRFDTGSQVGVPGASGEMEYRNAAPVVFQPGQKYIMTDGRSEKVLGSATTPEEMAGLVDMSGKLPYGFQLFRANEQGGFTPGQEIFGKDDPRATGLLGAIGNYGIPIAAGLLTGPLGPLATAAAAAGTAGVTKLTSGYTPKDALTAAAISGLTAGALKGITGPTNLLGLEPYGTAAKAATEAAAQTVPALGNIIPGAAQASSSALGGFGAEPIINVITNRVGDALTAPLSSLIGSGVAAAAPALGGPMQGQPSTVEKQAPTPGDKEIAVLADRIPPSVINTPPLPLPPIDYTGITPTLPDLAVQPEVAPADEELKVEADRIREELSVPPLSSTPAPLIVPQVPQIDTPKTPLQKALTTGGRVLTGLSLLGGLAGGGGQNASGLGTGAAAIGTRASLDPVFGGQLPPARGIFAQGSRAPRVMGDIDYERYGYGPARSFFENVPETPEQYRAALAANAPRPVVAGAGTVGVPNFLSNFIPPTAGSAALQAVRRLAPGVPDAQIEAFLATPEGADFLAALQEAETPQGAARGGAMAVRGRGKPSRNSYAVNGAGDGRSDEIPALLSDGEYVIDAETVALLGDGSSKAGAKRLDDLRVKIRKHKGRNLARGRFSDNAKAPEKYLSGGRT
jgi:hypothetical protein